MRKLFAVFLTLVIAGAAWSQTALNPALLDLSSARLSVAGPDRIYVRSLGYGGAELSVLLQYDGRNGVTVHGPYLADEKLIPDTAELAYARLRTSGRDALAFTDIVMGGVAYSGRLLWDGGTSMVLESYSTGPAPETNEQKMAMLEAEARAGSGYRDQVTRLTALLEAARTDLAAQTRSGAASREQVTTLTTELGDARAELAQARRAAQATAAAATTEVPAWRTVLTAQQAAGFRPTTFGSWKATDRALTQADGTLKYAKYVVPFAQTAQHTQYAFTAKAGATGWVGFGLHFFASGSTGADAYGLGRSYLVWLTRDESFYGTKRAYVQLYESMNDTDMIQLASANLGLDLTSPVNTEVVYDRTEGTVQVRVNGELALTQVVDPLSRGDTIAARSLGAGVELSSFSVRAY
jgi:hypothetical protein